MSDKTENREYPAADTGFKRYLAGCNGLGNAGFREWLFYPGMLFNSLEKWWGDQGQRHRPHEGVDLCFYRNKNGERCQLHAGAKVPAMFDGNLVTTAEDFLGESIFLRHRFTDSQGRRLYSFYGHIIPWNALKEDAVLREGETLAVLAVTQAGKTPVLPHLHLSVAWVPDSIPVKSLCWEIIGNHQDITLLDPLRIIDLDYSMIPLDKS
jgi:hypothetical protein